MQADLEESNILHLFVIDGDACIKTRQCEHDLHRGGATTFTDDGGVWITNSGDRTLSLIQVNIGGNLIKDIIGNTKEEARE